ncbi:bark storage protein A-like [Tasmannia lanceolata]|uniref:bark storage protein A-like n=1 Tax=Tasmannia lanceolata TaxID=3420 RepID=UPI00406371CF
MAESKAKIGRPRVVDGLPMSIGRSWICVEVALLIALLSSWQVSLSHPLRGMVEKVNREGPYLGLVMAYETEEKALQSSGLFTPSTDVPFLDLSGRRFHVGAIQDVSVIYAMSGQRRLNAGITVQILVDIFDIWGIVHYGTAGSANDSLSFGDVSVPRLVAFTGAWEWTKFKSKKGELPELSFGAYDLPEKGGNLLARVEIKPEEFYSVNNTAKLEEVFWLDMNTTWYQAAAEQLQDLELLQCVNETYCLPETPKVVFGLRGSTADIFVDNAAFRDFLFETFNVSTVDEESAAVVMTAMSSALPVIVFRGVSDLAGGDSNWSSTSLSSLAATNALKTAIEFIALIGKEKSTRHE